MLSEILQEVGLNNRESHIFLTLARYGALPASIVAGKIQMNRITAYQILKSLADRGIVAISIKAGVQYFSAESIATLRRCLEKQRQALEASIHRLTEAEKLFENIRTPTSHHSSINMVQGISGLRVTAQSLLRTGRKISWVGDIHFLSEDERCVLARHLIVPLHEKSKLGSIVLTAASRKHLRELQLQKLFDNCQFVSGKEFQGNILACVCKDYLVFLERVDGRLTITRVESYPMYRLFSALLGKFIDRL